MYLDGLGLRMKIAVPTIWRAKSTVKKLPSITKLPSIRPEKFCPFNPGHSLCVEYEKRKSIKVMPLPLPMPVIKTVKPVLSIEPTLAIEPPLTIDTISPIKTAPVIEPEKNKLILPLIIGGGLLLTML